MVDRFYGYQSETSPRQLQPEYRPYRNKYPEKTSTTVKTRTTKDTTKTKQVQKAKPKKQEDIIVHNSPKQKKSIKPRVKLIFLLALGFSLLFTVSYRNSIINETFSRKEELKEELNSIQKTNEQLRVSIENSLNLTNVEQEAKERVGMQKLTSTQKIYVNLEKKDYVEAASEEIIIEEETNFFDKILNGFVKSL